MKKTFFSIVFLTLISTTAIFANGEPGFLFNIDYPVNLIKPTYIAETITFRYNFNELFGLDGGVRFMESFYRYSSKEPIMYIAPLMDFYAGFWYIGAGCFIPIESEPSISLYARTGLNLGNWHWGLGRACLNVGVEVSFTTITHDANGDPESVLGSVLSSVFETLFNIPKLNIGLTYFLPLKKSALILVPETPEEDRPAPTPNPSSESEPPLPTIEA